MKIVRSSAQNNWLRFGAILLILLILLAVLLLLDRQQLAAELGNLRQNWASSATAVSPATLTLDIDFNDYQQLLDQRAEARENNVFLGSDTDFVSADLTWDGSTIPVQMRLQQGPAKHLGDDEKWNFEVRSDDAPILGMNRFYLIDPADNQWLNEWGYQQTLHEAGILSTQIEFVTLILNGSNLGTYMVQEKPDFALIADQERPLSVIVEFDPTSLWQNIAYFEGDTQAAANDPVTNLSEYGWQFLEVDTFRDDIIARDEVLAADKEQAIALLSGFQQGDLPATAVFDMEKMGLFLALSDLWGAVDAVQTANLRYYYNPETGLLEPIGFNGNPALENGRINLSAATFTDPALQTAYVQAVQQITEPAYLAQLQTVLQPAWEQYQQSLDQNIKPPWTALAQQQTVLNRSIHPQRPAFAAYHVANNNGDPQLQIEISNITNLPLELVSLDINGQQSLKLEPQWTNQNSLIMPAFDPTATTRLTIPLAEVQNSGLAAADLNLGLRVMGTEFITAVPVHHNPDNSGANNE